METVLPIANGFYESDSLPLSAQECVNWFPSIPDAPSLNQEVLFGTPGLSQAATTGTSTADVNRGGLSMGGIAYFVNGTGLYRLNSDETVSASLGTVTGTARVSMATNGTQLLILVPGSTGYLFTAPSTFATISDADFTTTNGAPQYVTFVDGYFIATTDADTFIASGLNDGVNWAALDFATAESNPDDTIAPFVYNNQLFIAGERTIEGFNNIGGADFPFQRSGLFLQQGVMAPHSIVDSTNTILFIGGGKDEGPAIWQLSGNSTQKVSTQAIDAVLQRLTTAELADVYAWSYAQAGHYFVGFSLPMTTFVYNLSNQRWHERKSYITYPDGTSATVRYRVNSMVTAYGKLYAGDSQDGRIGVVDLDVYQEYSGNIIRCASTQPFQNNMRPFFVPSLELTVESGVGNANATDPQIRMARSLDGGKTFGDDRTRAIGKVGEYNRRAIWRRNGRVSRFDVYRFTLSDPVKPVILQLTADIRDAA